MSGAPEAEIREWLDRLAIQDLIHRYSDAVTRADFEQMASVFTPDAVWESPLLGMRFERASDFIGMQVEGKDSLEILIQTAHNTVIELDSRERARATTTIHERMRGTAAETPSLLADAGAALNVDQYGIYSDDVAKIQGEWKFTHRLFTPLLIASGTVTGDVVTTRPAVARPGG